MTALGDPIFSTESVHATNWANRRKRGTHYAKRMIEDLRLFDADNHYYETADAFTRYLDPSMIKRSVQWTMLDGRRRLLVAGKINRLLANPTFDPIARPGSLMAYFRSNNVGGADLKELFGTLDALDDHPEFFQREARLKTMDLQGLESAFLFPTLGVLLLHALIEDIDALHATYHAFNRWLAEEWGFDHLGRIYAAPVIIMADPELAAAEVDWAVEHGARILCMVPGPVPNRHGATRSPASADLDPVWARIQEAGVPVGFHGTDKVLDRYVAQWEEPNKGFAMFASTFSMAVSHGRPMFDTMAALMCHGLFARFPDLRIATIETGSHWVGHFLQEIGSVYGKRPQEFIEPPIETFRRQVWVSPFFEDDFNDLRDLIGADRILFGSDWPHAEGLDQPADYVKEIDDFDNAQKAAVLGGNARNLIALPG
jgi:predicted TIM-barrel fold metal-dependent hydrolase